MKYPVRAVAFPAAVNAVAAQDGNGIYVIYTNAQLPPEAQREEIQEMERRIDKEGV